MEVLFNDYFLHPLLRHHSNVSFSTLHSVFLHERDRSSFTATQNQIYSIFVWGYYFINVSYFSFRFQVYKLTQQIRTRKKSRANMATGIVKLFLPLHLYFWPITETARSKAWTVFDRSNAEIVGSNPSQGTNVCVHLFCVRVVLCVGSALAKGWSPAQCVLPTVCRIKKLKKRPRSNKGL
jgi:hypothetical protein